MYSRETVKRVVDASSFDKVLSNITKSGRSYYCKCPACNKEGKGKGLSIQVTKNIAKCFSCDVSYSSPLDYLIKQEGLKFPDAVKKLADLCGIIIETEYEEKKRIKQLNRKPKPKQKSFCDLQLESSGLTYDDVRAEIIEDKATVKRPTFLQGTLSQYGQLLEGQGDDMLIYYYDLEGKPVMYQKKNSRNQFEHLIRVRWQNPDVHLDKYNKAIKYQSPAGSGSHLYIPEKVRQLYKYSRPIERLFIQEGEKKAEKCCKHGIISVGIMGIQNFGQGGQLPAELQLLIHRCEVKEVIFVLDSDFNKLSSNLKNGDSVDTRPRSFFYAVKNYKAYMRTLLNLNLNVETYFGYVKPGTPDKGIDDLLANTLKAKEDTLLHDINYAMNEKDGEGEWVKVHKITYLNDAQIADIWHLNDAEAFAETHRQELKDLAEFKIGRLLRRFDEDGKLEMAQPLLPSEQFWEEKDTKQGKELQFDYYNCFTFLRNRGFGRIRMKSDKWDFCSLTGRVVTKVDNYDIKDFVTEFTKEIKKIDVLNMLYRGGPQYLGPEKLSNLDYFNLLFERAGKTSQCLFFKTKYWEIDADGIKEYPITQLKHYVWSEKIIDADVTLLSDPLLNIQLIDDLDVTHFEVTKTGNGTKCDFLRFLENASNFYWRKVQKGEEITQLEHYERHKHLLNKLTAIGFLLHDYKNDSEEKAVVAMDGKISEVGTSNGRTGKSLLGRCLEYVIPQVYIPAKSKDLTKDQFLFGEVTEKTKNLFIDDVRANFDFEFFFPIITAKMKVNPKGAPPFTLDKADSPKLLITTNHAINGEGSSFRDRQAFVVFSDYYNDDHKPIDDFGRNFFSEWDREQWNLFYNLMAKCLQLYFRSIKEDWAGKNQGIIPPPMDDVEARRLRQMMGEDFLTWAEAYFSPDPEADDPSNGQVMLNKRIKRQEMHTSFKTMFPQSEKYINSTGFGKRIKFYCQYKGLHFNPHKPNEKGIDFNSWCVNFPERSFTGTADKTGGSEYFLIADNSYLAES